LSIYIFYYLWSMATSNIPHTMQRSYLREPEKTQIVMHRNFTRNSKYGGQNDLPFLISPEINFQKMREMEMLLTYLESPSVCNMHKLSAIYDHNEIFTRNDIAVPNVLAGMNFYEWE
jgi:hypothetical protein